MFTPDNPLLIGVTGLPRAGKSAFTRLLPELCGLQTVVVEGSDVMRNKYFDGRMDIPRTVFAAKANELGERRLNNEIMEVVDSLKAPIKCISGVRILPAYLEIARRGGIFVVVQADPEVRVQRPSGKVDEKSLTLEEMVEKDHQGRELIIHALTQIADYRISNNGSEADFIQNMAEMWQLIEQGRIPFRLTLPY